MNCAVCEDTGWKTIEVDGVARVTRCECRINRQGQDRLTKANIPIRYRHCTLENFDAYNDSLKRAVKYAGALVAEFPARTTERNGLLFIGLPGVGKTHLAVAMLKQCIQNGGTGLFCTTTDLMVRLRSTYYVGQDGDTESDVLKEIAEVDVLVLDDLGRERSTEWRDEMLHLVINARYSNRRPTILTTNFDVGDLDDPQSLQARVGLRVYSRLNEMCEIIDLDAADYRERPTNARTEDLLAMWKMRKKTPLPSPRGSRSQARAALKDGKGDLKWAGGRAGNR